MSEEFKPRFLAERLEMRILIGVASITAMIILLGWIAIKENARMEEFTERSLGRSIEAGGRIFESSCSACHGNDALGKPGVAPALNNPHLFGYSFFEEIDNEVLLINARIETASDADEILRLQDRLNILAAERTALEETILYDFTDQVERIDEELVALDAEIIKLEGIDDASRLPLYISQRERDELVPLQQELDGLKALGEPVEAPAPDEAAAEGAVTEGDTEAAPSEATPAPEGDSEAAPSEVTPVPEGDSEAAVPEEAPAEDAEAAPAAEEGEGEQEAPQQEQPTEPTEEELRAIAVEQVLVQYPLLTEEQAGRFVDLEAEIAVVEASLQPYNDLKTARDALLKDRGEYLRLTDAQREVERLRTELAGIEAQIAELTELPEDDEDFEDPDAAAREELTNQSVALRTEIDNADIERIKIRGELVASGLVQSYDPNKPSRLEQVAWAGSLFDFVEGTLTGGRPPSAGYWPNPMAAWSQLAGGPLRPDQIRNLSDYILNFDREFTIRDLHSVKQMARVPTSGASTGPPINTTNVTLVIQDLAAQLEAGDIDAGVPEDGLAVFQAMGCSGCHGVQNLTGPALTGLWTRVTGNQDDRLTATAFEDNPEHYLIQSIIIPDTFVVPGFTAGLMPPNFNERISYQDLANLLAFLETQE